MSCGILSKMPELKCYSVPKEKVRRKNKKKQPEKVVVVFPEPRFVINL